MTDSVSVTGVSGMVVMMMTEILCFMSMSMSDGSGTVEGGHLTDNNTVLLTFDVVIGELGDGAEMGGAYDEDLDVHQTETEVKGRNEMEKRGWIVYISNAAILLQYRGVKVLIDGLYRRYKRLFQSITGCRM